MEYIINADNVFNNRYIGDLLCKCDTKSMKDAFLKSMDIITNVCILHYASVEIITKELELTEEDKDNEYLSRITVDIDFEYIEQKLNISHDNALRAEQLLIDNNVIRPVGYKGIIKL